ncbi:MAG: hypothetical protein V1678_02910 [Candidatus Aenigmatarchaeota archaeon]
MYKNPDPRDVAVSEYVRECNILYVKKFFTRKALDESLRGFV